MKQKILYSGISLISVATVGIIFAVAMELATDEPIYFLIMKATAGLLGIGGCLMGLASIVKK